MVVLVVDTHKIVGAKVGSKSQGQCQCIGRCVGLGCQCVLLWLLGLTMAHGSKGWDSKQRLSGAQLEGTSYRYMQWCRPMTENSD